MPTQSILTISIIESAVATTLAVTLFILLVKEVLKHNHTKELLQANKMYCEMLKGKVEDCERVNKEGRQNEGA